MWVMFSHYAVVSQVLKCARYTYFYLASPKKNASIDQVHFMIHVYDHSVSVSNTKQCLKQCHCQQNCIKLIYPIFSHFHWAFIIHQHGWAFFLLFKLWGFIQNWGWQIIDNGRELSKFRFPDSEILHHDAYLAFISVFPGPRRYMGSKVL